MKTAQLRKEFTKTLTVLNKQLTYKQKTKIAAGLDINVRTVENYMGGKVADIELAESMIAAAEVFTKS